MRLQLLSDLHLEAHPQFQPQPAPGAELLVLAGDIGSYQAGSLLPDADFGLARFSPLPQWAGWPTPVLFTPGNHEYDGLDFDTAHARLRATCERLGIVWLEREVVTLGGVRFVGTTLWSDFDALGPRADDPHATLGQQLRAREKPFGRRISTCARRAPRTTARRCSRPPCANSRCAARNGCARCWRGRGVAKPWSSRISRPACAARIRAMA